ncbi:MAG: hypothetical protein IPH31_14425 [Lewinellaceae bacterium]|nr:hypothetical protein [Lewinellaceae bacterium]
MKDSCVHFASQGHAVVLLTTGAVLKRWDTGSKSFSADVPLDLGLNYLDSSPDRDIRFSEDGTQLGVLTKVETNGEQWQFKSFAVNTGKQLTIRTFSENDGGWGSLTPDLQYFFTSPVVDVADVRAGMSAYSIITGKFSHYFGLKMLETTTDVNMAGAESEYITKGN